MRSKLAACGKDVSICGFSAQTERPDRLKADIFRFTRELDPAARMLCRSGIATRGSIGTLLWYRLVVFVPFSLELSHTLQGDIASSGVDGFVARTGHKEILNDTSRLQWRRGVSHKGWWTR